MACGSHLLIFSDSWSILCTWCFPSYHNIAANFQLTSSKWIYMIREQEKGQLTPVDPLERSRKVDDYYMNIVAEVKKHRIYGFGNLGSSQTSIGMDVECIRELRVESRSNKYWTMLWHDKHKWRRLYVL